MKTTLNVVLSAIGAAALLASAAVAQSARIPTPSNSTVPSEAPGSVAPYTAQEGGHYAPSIPTMRWGRELRYPEIRQIIY
jgi:hypothetical protein